MKTEPPILVIKQSMYESTIFTKGLISYNVEHVYNHRRVRRVTECDDWMSEYEDVLEYVHINLLWVSGATKQLTFSGQYLDIVGGIINTLKNLIAPNSQTIVFELENKDK